MVTLLLRTRFGGDSLAADVRGGGALVARNAYVHRADLWVLVSGIAEPFLYLLSLGIGMGALVGTIPYAGGTVDYAVYVAPAMLAAAAMNGAVTESTYNVFAKMKFMKLYEGVLATPVTPTGIALGEIGWALLRSSIYAAFFVLTMALMGLSPSWWTIAALPAAVLIGLAFSAAGMAFTTYLRSWQDFDYITVMVFLLFLFSGTFAPVEVYPVWLQWLVGATPLYHGVALVRGLTTGAVTLGLLWHVAYLLVLALIGLAIASRRMRRMLTP
ncbi:MAG: ABC transporter permease [Micromonosporaceae bacterium]